MDLSLSRKFLKELSRLAQSKRICPFPLVAKKHYERKLHRGIRGAVHKAHPVTDPP